MDWEKVIESLLKQSNWSIEQVNKYSQMSGYHEAVKECRAVAGISAILAAALSAGLTTKAKS